MAAGQNGVDPMAYRPTSLDFINRPNPVEPHAVPEKHPLNDTQRLEKNSQAEFLRLLIDQNGSSTAERPAKRRKSGDANLLDLPKLPAVRSNAKRLRIPPTLSGLHQPPPNAGLLPSISVDQPISLPKRNLPTETKTDTESKSAHSNSSLASQPKEDVEPNREIAAAKQKRRKWSNDETADLLKGVAKFGIGNWTQILNCPDYHFHGRTGVDLKDRFRVCCPNDYKSTPDPKNGKAAKDRKDADDATRAEPKFRRPNRSDRKSSSELLRLGIKEPFEKSKRRRRTDYTAAEDEALLLGFRKHGNSWAAIRKDPTFKLAHRRATDLRDRFRTKYPEQYEKAGLAPKRDIVSKRASAVTKESSTTDEYSKADTEVKEKAIISDANKTTLEANRSEKENKVPGSSAPPKKPPAASLFHYDPDVFWGAPFDVDETETERVTLDRRILDWPSETSRASASADPSRNDIDPLATFNLPKHFTGLSHNSATASKGSGAGAALPSLADITAGSDDFAEHLELPSLMGAFGTLDGDGRTGGQIPSLDELWK